MERLCRYSSTKYQRSGLIANISRKLGKDVLNKSRRSPGLQRCLKRASWSRCKGFTEFRGRSIGKHLSYNARATLRHCFVGIVWSASYRLDFALVSVSFYILFYLEYPNWVLTLLVMLSMKNGSPGSNQQSSVRLSSSLTAFIFSVEIRSSTMVCFDDIRQPTLLLSPDEIAHHSQSS